MVKKKDKTIKDSGYFAKKRAEREYYSPEARAARQKLRDENREKEAKDHVSEMLEHEREALKEKQDERERMWKGEPTPEKPRIQIKDGKTAFKPEDVPGEIKSGAPKPVEKGATDKPKAVIKKRGQRAQDVTLNEKPVKDISLGEKEIKPPPIEEPVVEERARIISKEAPPRPMLKTKEQDTPQYDEDTLAKETVMQDIKVKSLGNVPKSHMVKRGDMSELDDSATAKTYNKANEEQRVYRHELKYYISEADYLLLRNSLNCLLKHDSNAGENGDYYIRSLYFDDYNNTAMVDKLSGIENRKKYRIRIYGLSDNFIRLERKNKNKEYISKDNLVLTRDEYDKIINGDIDFLLKKKNQLAKDFFYEMKTKQLKPMVIVDYVREAYVHPIRNLRVTFDKVVKSGRYNTSIFEKDVPLASVLPPGTVVLEIKFQKGMPDYLIGVLNTITASQRSAISKYALCRKYES